MSTISDRHETVDGIKSTFVAGIREQGAARARKDIDRLSIDFADTIRRDIVGMGSVVHVAVVNVFVRRNNKDEVFGDILVFYKVVNL